MNLLDAALRLFGKHLQKNKISINKFMPTQYKFIKNFLSPIECDNFIGKLPLLDINTAPAIDRENEEVPLDTWYRLELLPTRIELNVSHTILSKISKLLEKQVSAMDNRMYVIRYQEGEFCVPHVDPTEKTIIIQLNSSYTGGDFVYNNEVIPMNKGDAVIFSNIDSVHGVKMLTSGERYSLAMWLKDDI